jgi:CRISPR-associated protein Csd1
MLLKRLAEYSARLESRPMLYGEVVVRYIIELNSVGRPLSPEPTDISNPATPRTKRGQHRLMPQIQRSRGVNPILFADKAEYTLGITSGSTKHAARITKCHRAYMSILGRCAERTGLLEVRAVWHFLEGTPLSKLELGEDFDGAAALTFRVNGIFPSDLPAVQRFWAEEHNPANPASREARMMQCIVCGETRPVLSRLQAKIKGIPGGQTSGTAIISANADAFESYGLQASLIAPTCAECGESFTHSINDLLQNEANHLIIGRAVFIFWTRDASDFSFRDFLIAPQSVQVRELIQSVRSDHRNNNFMDNAFYAIALSASGGRVAVRDWIDSTVAKVRSNLARWFKRQSIIASFGEFPCLFGIASLAGSTVRERRDLHPATACAILRAALMGTPLPFGLLYETVRRNRVEKEVTSARAALIKLAICSAPRAAMEDTMVSLDRQDHSPAYLCGRLLAVLERAQRLAIPRIRRNATIVGRFFSIASSAPLSVFPRLLCGTQTHLAKLERDHPGAYVALQRKIEEIITGISAFPSLLTLEEQGFFALGYYHQRAHDRGQAKEKWSMGEAAEVVEASDTGRE